MKETNLKCKFTGSRFQYFISIIKIVKEITSFVYHVALRTLSQELFSSKVFLIFILLERAFSNFSSKIKLIIETLERLTLQILCLRSIYCMMKINISQ